MEINTQFDRVECVVPLRLKERAVKTECRIQGVGETDRILSLSSRVTPINAVCREGGANFTAKAVFSCIYLSGDSIRLAEGGVEFSSEFNDENLKTGDKINVTYSVERTSYRRADGHVIAECYVKVTGESERNRTINYLVGGEDILTRRVTTDICVYNGCYTGSGVQTEESEVNGVIKNVIKTEAVPYITDSICEVGRITVSGKVAVCFIALQSDEKQGIIKINKDIPFRVEIDAPNVNGNDKAYGTVCLKSIKTDIVNDEESGISNFTTTVNLQFSVKTYKTMQLEIANDLFNVNYETKTTEDYIPCVKHGDDKNYIKKISSEASTDCDITGITDVLFITSPTFTLTDVAINDGNATVTGVAEFTAIVEKQETVTSVRVSLPVSETFDGNFKGDINVYGDVTDCELRIIDDKAYAQLTFNVRVYSTESYNCPCITGVELGNEKQKNDKAISIYFAPKGCTLWDITKLTGACESEIMQTNANLTFPLEKEERVVIYRPQRIEY